MSQPPLTIMRPLSLGRLDDRVIARRVEPEEVEALLHMRRQRRGDVDRPARPRVRDDDAPGQEVELVLEAARQLPVLDVEVFRVADDRMADMGGVGAQLVGAPGDGLQRQPGELLRRRLDDGVIGERVARALVAVLGDAHARVLVADLLLGEVGRDPALPHPRHAGDDGPVDLARRARAEGLAERHGGKARLRDDEAAGRVLVEAMDEARLLALLVAQRLKQAVDVALRPRPALDRKAGGLVEDENVLVLVERDRLEKAALVLVAGGPAGRDLLRLEPERRDADSLTGLEPLLRFRPLTVDPELAFSDNPLDVGEG